jgi:hypothetical protein
MREAFQKALGGRDVQSMSQEERQKFFQEMRTKMGGQLGGMRQGGGQGRPGGEGGAEGRPPAGPQGPGMITFQRPGGGGEAPDLTSMSLRQGASQQFAAADREKAQLPSPPEEGSVMDVLLRPGLLVESEIIVEKIPNTLYVPQQAVFDKGGRSVVFVRAGARYEPRSVKLGKRTESQVAVVEGLREGDWIALQDMETGPQQAPKKTKDKDKGKGKGRTGQPDFPAGPKASLEPRTATVRERT